MSLKKWCLNVLFLNNIFLLLNFNLLGSGEGHSGLHCLFLWTLWAMWNHGPASLGLGLSGLIKIPWEEDLRARRFYQQVGVSCLRSLMES